MFAIPESKMQPWCDDRRKIGLDIPQLAAAVVGKARLDQKIYGDRPQSLNLPALPGWISLVVEVPLKPGAAQPFGQGMVAAVIKQCDAQP